MNIKTPSVRLLSTFISFLLAYSSTSFSNPRTLGNNTKDDSFIGLERASRSSNLPGVNTMRGKPENLSAKKGSAPTRALNSLSKTDSSFAFGDNEIGGNTLATETREVTGNGNRVSMAFGPSTKIGDQAATAILEKYGDKGRAELKSAVATYKATGQAPRLSKAAKAVLMFDKNLDKSTVDTVKGWMGLQGTESKNMLGDVTFKFVGKTGQVELTDAKLHGQAGKIVTVQTPKGKKNIQQPSYKSVAIEPTQNNSAGPQAGPQYVPVKPQQPSGSVASAIGGGQPVNLPARKPTSPAVIGRATTLPALSRPTLGAVKLPGPGREGFKPVASIPKALGIETIGKGVNVTISIIVDGKPVKTENNKASIGKVLFENRSYVTLDKNFFKDNSAHLGDLSKVRLNVKAAEPFGFFGSKPTPKFASGEDIDFMLTLTR